MLCFVYFLTADRDVARPHADMFDQQTKMEILLSDLLHDATLRFRNHETGDFKPVCEWDGVTCNDNSDVIQISWYRKGIDDGSMCFDLLPETITIFDITECSVEGTLRASALPRGIESFNAACNRLFGTIAFAELPAKIEIFNVINNGFTGTIDFEHLPEALEYFFLEKNAFEGSAVLSLLPQRLCLIDCAYNQLTGSLNLTNLPESLHTLRLHYNQFQGNVVVHKAFNVSTLLRGNGALQVVNEAGEPVESDKVQIPAKST